MSVALTTLGACYAQHDGKKNAHSHKHEQKAINHKSKEEKQSSMKIEKPRRISHTYEQRINGNIEEIMPLYCPVRELDWCENWNPTAVYSNSGVVEKDCIFITSHGDTDIVWIVTDYDIAKGYVKMFYHVPGVLVNKLEIQLAPMGEKETKAVITYSKTSLNEIGDKALDEFTKAGYNTMMDSWEKAMNHYLKTGELLTGLPNF